MVPQQQRRRRRRAALPRTSERRVVVVRGAGGFGFTIAGQRPCVVSAVAVGGPAERAGLRAGDALLAVDGASVSRAPHASVARLVAAAPQAISLSVAPRESPPTDTEDTEPDERARTRRRHPPPRRRPQQPPLLHHPGCHAAPSTSAANEILQNLSRIQLNPGHGARLECRAVIGYLGTIDTPRAASETAPASVKTAVKRLRQERRPAANILLSVLPNVLILRRSTGQTLAQYARERIVYAGCSSDADRRYFGLVTAAELTDNDTEVSHSCHVFAVDSRLAEHEAHINRAREFQIACTRDPVAERCLEFPPSAEYVVGVIKGMYSLPADDFSSPVLQQLSKLTVKSDSPGVGNFVRCNRAALRMPRMARRPCRHDDARMDAPDFVANSPQPSNHSEMTTTSSNSDSGIGYHDGRNVADRILVVDFGNQQPINRYRPDAPRRPMGLVGINFEDGSFLSNTTPVVDGFGGQGRPLNHLDDVMLNPNDLQHLQGRYPVKSGRAEESRPNDTYNYNNVHYGNVPSTSRMGAIASAHEPVYSTKQESHYEMISQQKNFDLDIDQENEASNSVEIYEDRQLPHELCHSNDGGSVDNLTVISGSVSKASMDSVSVYSTRSHEEARPTRRKHLQASLDDMLVIGRRDEQRKENCGEDNFVHPGNIKFKVRKTKLNLLSRTKHILTGKQSRHKRSSSTGRVSSASAGDVGASEIPRASGTTLANSEPDLRDDKSEQSSPFRRWTTGIGAGSSYRHQDHRNIYNKQMSENSSKSDGGGGGGGVTRWSLGLEQLLADPAGAAAFAHFLHNEFAAENIRFWWSCEQYARAAAEARGALARQIWARHLCERAPEPVNVDAAARRAAAPALHDDQPPPDLFQQAQKQIFNVMKFDSYPRFLRSHVHAECARADLRGLPPPYPAPPATTPTKLKKSASNASERRRSTTSLFPWKRAASKERDGAEPPAPPPAAPPADVVAGYSLCRVVLPDGATSVVGVDREQTVGALVERLLQRRNLPCASYDVLLRDDQSEPVSVECSAPSSVLGGRCAVVERRCVVRLVVGARCVALRGRATRTLADALKPVQARYWPQRRARVLRGSSAVPLTTTLQELDGARLVVVEETEQSSDSVPEHVNDAADDDAPRLTDDADSQSIASSVSRGEGGAGRVRAALRAGPALQHHPPDFLENLRETQRIRLTRDAGGIESRSPPPLPPKPRPPPALV